MNIWIDSIVEAIANAEGRFPPGPPDVGSSPIEQYLTYRNFLADPLQQVTEWMAAYGDVMHYKSGDRHQYLIANPDMIREILVRQAQIFIKGSEYTNEKNGLGALHG